MRHAVIASLALLLAGLAAAPSPAGGPLRDFLKQLQDRREQASQGYQQWQQQQQQSYRDQRYDGNKFPPGTPSLDLNSQGIPPGQYKLELPLGMQMRVNVQGNAQPQAQQGQWGDRAYGDAAQYAGQIHSALRQIRWELGRHNLQDLERQAADLVARAGRLNEASRQRAAPDQVRQEYAAFDQQWHAFAQQARGRGDLPASVRNQIAEADRADQALHQIYQTAPGPVYDRLRAAGLTYQLAGTTDKLARRVRKEGDSYVARRVERVDRLAQDLAYTVQQNSPFSTVVDEYRRFDEAWHDLVEHLQGDGAVGEQVRQTARDVWQIDRELHNVLQVNAPVYFDRTRLANLADRIRKTADHLAEDLRYDLPADRLGLIPAAEDVRYSAREVGERLRQGGDRGEVEDAAGRLLRSWRQFQDRVPANPDRDRFGHTLEVYTELGRDIEEFRTQLSGQGPRG